MPSQKPLRTKQRFLVLVFKIAFSLLLLLHFFVFPLPIAELFLAYIILFNPPWFRKMLEVMAERER